MASDILIVDDEEDIRELVAGILSDEGHETRTAHDSDSALAAIADRVPRLVFLDIWLQGSRLDGLAILDQLEQGRFALRDNVVTLTGSASSQADYVAVTDALSEGLPQGLVLARAEIFPPKAEAFQWTATKSSDGAIALTGMVPDPEAEQALLRASGASTDRHRKFASRQARHRSRVHPAAVGGSRMVLGDSSDRRARSERAGGSGR